MATDALLARRASSLPAASQVLIAACRAVDASSRAWAIVGKRVAQRSIASQAALDHFSGEAVISDLLWLAPLQQRYAAAAKAAGCFLVCYRSLAEAWAGRIHTGTLLACRFATKRLAFRYKTSRSGASSPPEEPAVSDLSTLVGGSRTPRPHALRRRRQNPQGRVDAVLARALRPRLDRPRLLLVVSSARTTRF